jgi:DNA (cytosine-5)-methyltransferase 1
MSRPKLLDLFCCEGGASEGYRRAGFDVYGVDRFRYFDERTKTVKGHTQARYPFPSFQGDVVAVMRSLLAGTAITFTAPNTGDLEPLGLEDFAAIAASPPCQFHSVTKHSHNVKHVDLIPVTRILLKRTGLPYVIENVVGAPLVDPVMLCGSEFALTAYDPAIDAPVRLERHRLFESNVFLLGGGGCVHDRGIQVAGAYGGGSVDRNRAKNVRRGGYTPAKPVRAALLGIDWMTQDGLSQSIPPAYTEHLGRQLLDHLNAEKAAA